MHMCPHLYLLGAISKFNPFHHYIFTSLRISTFILILILTPLISTPPSQLCALKKKKNWVHFVLHVLWSVGPCTGVYATYQGPEATPFKKTEFPSPKPLTDYLQLGPLWGHPCSNPAMSRRHCFLPISLNCDSYSLPCCLFCNGPWALGVRACDTDDPFVS